MLKKSHPVLKKNIQCLFKERNRKPLRVGVRRRFMLSCLALKLLSVTACETDNAKSCAKIKRKTFECYIAEKSSIHRLWSSGKMYRFKQSPEFVWIHKPRSELSLIFYPIIQAQ